MKNLRCAFRLNWPARPRAARTSVSPRRGRRSSPARTRLPPPRRRCRALRAPPDFGQTTQLRVLAGDATIRHAEPTAEPRHGVAMLPPPATGEMKIPDSAVIHWNAVCQNTAPRARARGRIAPAAPASSWVSTGQGVEEGGAINYIFNGASSFFLGGQGERTHILRASWRERRGVRAQARRNIYISRVIRAAAKICMEKLGD